MLVPARARSVRSPEEEGHQVVGGMIRATDDFHPIARTSTTKFVTRKRGSMAAPSKPLVSPVVATASRSRSARLTSSPLSTTRSFRSPIRPAPWCPGRPVAMSASRAPVSPRRTPLVWLPSPPPARRWNTASRRSTCSSRARVPVVKPPSVPAVCGPRGWFHHRRHPASPQRRSSSKRRRV